MSKQPHINVTPDQVAKRVIVCGDPDRINRIGLLLDDTKLVSNNREYRIINGSYQGHAITLCSTGIGAPSTIIAIEELNICGAKYIVRVGSAGALQGNIGLGELIIAEAAVRDEGGSKAYVAPEFPAYSDRHLVAGIEEYLNTQEHTSHFGIVRSHDSFYTDNEDLICEQWSKKGILGSDMETSALLTVGKIRELKTASILNNVVLYRQDVQEGINQYLDANNIMMQGEKMAAKAALHTLCRQP